MPTTNILILGAGAIGAFYASRLALAPNTLVSVICRSNHAAVSHSGFSITSPTYGHYTFRPAHIFASPAEAAAAHIVWDYILVSTKALPDVSDDSEILTSLLSKNKHGDGAGTAVVLVQNGLGVEEPYAARFPNTVILSAVTIASAAQNTPGVITHNRWTRISIGPYLPPSTSPSTSPLNSQNAIDRNSHFTALLRAGGITDADAYTHSKLQMVRWHKIAINASMNPSAVLSHGTPNALMSADPELSIHLLACMREVLSTAPIILGCAFPADFASAEAILRSTQKNTSGSKPSMLLDWEKGARMEIEVILGNPIRIAREHGLEMPRLQSLYALLRMAQENREAAKKEKEMENSKL
ncbi:Uncharacterized protein LOCC1_G005004 [Lachnellula occidentalis]|uniref:2-dehydropantoate 2-reductase n=1 Tax=Lachnellula occidentalis TaxID=215460 RepID=A0A8H8UFW5_9HELO|nr:Uncharacterized protein LOCC1_G005004 [Lachnellula occidentalis]